MVNKGDAMRPVVWSDYACELGEGARWIDGRLIHVDILGGVAFALDGSTPYTGEVAVIADVGVPLGAVAAVANRPGTWIAAAGHGVGFLGTDGLVPIADLGEADTMRVNDAGCDPHGRFWFTTMAYADTPGAGALYRVETDGTVTQALSGLTIPNGPAFTAETMYLSHSAEGSIDAYPYRPDTGELGPPRRFVALEAGLTPDGLTVDVFGHLWVAVWDGGQVRRYRPDGTLERVLRLPTARPTSCCFGGPELNRLFVTTAALGLDDPAAGKVYAFDLDITGRPAEVYRPPSEQIPDIHTGE